MATLTVPYSFVPATSIVASEVNSNFGAVKTFVEALAAGTNLDTGSIASSKLAPATIQLLAPTGAINAYAGSIAPTGWLLCDGAAVSRATYADLFALIGTTYGVGDGTTTFNLPDMKGRVIVGKAATGTFAALNNKGGAETHTLVTGEMPSHAHTADGDLTAASAGGHSHTADGDLTAASAGSHSHTADGDLTAASAGSHGHTASSGTTGGHAHTGTVDSGGFHDHTAPTRNTTSSTHTHQSGTRFSVGATATNESDTSRNVDYGGTHTHTFTSAANGDHSHSVTVDGGGSHSHDVTGSTSTSAAHTHDVTGSTSAVAGHTHDITGSTSNTGGGGAHNNLQPYIVVNYIIKI
jgi:microcystin-dependent protein